MPLLKLRTDSGQIVELRFAELLEVDGREYRPGDEAPVAERLAFLEGRISAIEFAIFRPEETTAGGEPVESLKGE